jgi:hypothetical protein
LVPVNRFIYDEKQQLAKHYPLGELIFLDRESIHVGGVRFHEHIDDPVIGFSNRGRALEIMTNSEPISIIFLEYNRYLSGRRRPQQISISGASMGVCTTHPFVCNARGLQPDH